MSSWQDSLTSNSERLSHIYRKGEMSDVTFIVGRDGETKRRFKLHRFVLSMQSDVFFTMFYGSLPEKGQVHVIDIEPSIFEIVMKYVYEDFFSVGSIMEAMDTYCAAEKYNILHLRNLCIAYIADHASTENIQIVYGAPNILEVSKKVRSKCDEILSKETSFVLESANSVNAPLELVKDILQLEELSIGSEEELFQFIVKWARNSVSTMPAPETMTALRKQMDHVLPYIRFLAMNVEEFLSGPMRSRILSDSEKASILENLIDPGCRELPSWCYKSNERTREFSLKIVKNHCCTFQHGILRPSGTSLDENALVQINMVKGTLKFRGISFFVRGTGEPKARLSVDEASNESTSTYDPCTSLMKCTLLKSFNMVCSSKCYKIFLFLTDCSLKYCSKSANGAIIRNHFGEFRLSQFPNAGHIYEIFYN